MTTKPTTCKVCGKHETKTRRISWGKLCPKCGRERYIEATTDVARASGEYREKWRRGMARAAGVKLPD